MKKYIILVISIFILSVSWIIVFNYDSNKEQIIIKVDKNKKVNMEKYMCDIICNEMSEYYDYETVKAFCVVVRTNIIYSLLEEKDKVIDGKLIDKMSINLPYKELNYTTTDNKIYKQNVIKAINETKGEVVLYKNRIVYLPYHRISSGKTVNKQKNGDIIPYLKTANCFEDIENKDYLKIYYYDIDEGDRELLKNIVEKLNNSYITYNVDEMNNKLRIVTQGTGHNFGMSLYNAYVMSQKGYTYKDILNKFYKNIRIAKVYE